MSGKLLGVIGGSGLYSMKELKIVEKVSLNTPFGPPSEDVVIGAGQVVLENVSAGKTLRAVK